MNNKKTASLGFGLGLRSCHYQSILDQSPEVDWFEILSENYLIPGGRPLYYLDQICERYPVVMHGVSLSIGSTDPLDFNYLKKLKILSQRTNSKWISDHLCWTGVNGKNLHDLLPMPYTEEALDHVVDRVIKVQDFLGQQILLENPSTYLEFTEAAMTEAEFISELSKKSDCLILLDVNNVFVNSINHHFDAIKYIQSIPPARIQQIHLAGHVCSGSLLIDTHDQNVCDDVWDLYRVTINHTGPIATMIERDDDIPELEVLMKELVRAKQISQKILIDKAA